MTPVFQLFWLPPKGTEEEAYQNYLDSYPEGEYRSSARDRIEELQKVAESGASDEIWNSVNKGSIADLQNFVDNHSNSTYFAEATRLLRELRREQYLGVDIRALARQIKAIRTDARINNPEKAIYDRIVNYINTGKISVDDLLSAIAEDNNFISGTVANLLWENGIISDFSRAGIDGDFIAHMMSNITPQKFLAPEPITKITKSPCTEVYFWGIPSSGKSCALGAILSSANSGKVAKSMQRDPDCQGYGYMNRLANLFKTNGAVGTLPEGTAISSTYEMGFILEDEDRKEHPITCIDLAGELVRCMYKQDAGEPLTVEQQNVLKTLTDILVDNRTDNRKIHFFVIEYGAEDREYEGLPQNIYLEAAVAYIQRTGIFKKDTDGLYLLITKVDKAKAVGKALQEKGEATDEDSRKLKENIELLKEHQQMSSKLAQDIVEADKRASKAKQDLVEATEKLTKAQKDEARMQEVLNRYDQDTKINNAKKKLEEVEASQRAAKAKLEEAQAAEKSAKAAHEEYQTKKRLIALKEKGDMDATADETSSKKFQVAIEKATKAQKEYNDAIEKTRKAQEDYEKSTREVAEAKERLEKAEQSEIDNKREHVKALNEQTKALKKYGQAVDDINLDEIRDIDKTLGTKLKDLFPNDLPKSVEEFKDYIKSAFTELNDLDFGNFGSLLKDIGGGLLKNIFAKLPAEAKIAAAAIAAVTVAVNKLYESGKQQFFEGLSNIKQKLQPVISAIQSFGREAITAFESLTGTNIDLSSLMEIGPNFEYQMQKVGAIAGSTDKQLIQLTKSAEHLGGTTQFTASQVGEAFEYMAKHTWSVMEKSIAKNTGLNIGKLSYYVLLIYILYLFNIV